MKRYIVRYKQETLIEGYLMANNQEEADEMWNNGVQIEGEKEIDSSIEDLLSIEEG